MGSEGADGSPSTSSCSLRCEAIIPITHQWAWRDTPRWASVCGRLQATEWGEDMAAQPLVPVPSMRMGTSLHNERVM